MKKIKLGIRDWEGRDAVLDSAWKKAPWRDDTQVETEWNEPDMERFRRMF